MKTLLSLTLIIFSFFALANDEIKDSITQVQKIGEKEFYYLIDSYDSNDSIGSFLRYNYSLKYTNDGGKTFSHQHLDAINDMLIKEGNPLSEINIFFVDKSLGFIYGYITGFAYLPFLFRTEDAGKTWNRVNTSSTEETKVQTPLRKSDFFMFDKKRGIMLCNWGSEPIFKYKLTSDGGITWKPESYELNDKDFRIMNATHFLSAIYSIDGTVTIIIENHDFEMGKRNKVAIIRSLDFGESFVECFKN